MHSLDMLGPLKTVLASAKPISPLGKKRRISKNHIEFLKSPGWRGVPGTPCSVPIKWYFLYSKQQEILGHPALDPYGHPAGVLRIFLSLCAFFLAQDHGKGGLSLRGYPS